MINKINVELIDVMGNDDSVVNAARVSFNKSAENYSGNENEKLIKYLESHHHWSPFAHAFLQFRIKAPIFVARQLVKHQIGLSWNEVSRRYVDTSPEIYQIDEYRDRAENKKQGSEESVHKMNDTLKKLVNHHNKKSVDLYNDLIEYGVCPEQARTVLPQSMLTEWIWSGSLYAFSRICNLRLDPHAQKECRDVAILIDKHCREKFPISWKYLVKNDYTKRTVGII